MAVRRPSLVGARTKRARAQHHFDDLQAEVEPFFQNYEYDTEVVSDPSRNRYFIRLLNPAPIPDAEWAAIIGDCVHNLRSVFDYIAWELAGSVPADTRTQFPIYDQPQDFVDNRARRIGRLPQQAQDFIERMQPYHATAHRRDITRHFLRALHMLDIADKHKLLTPTIALPQAAGFGIEPDNLFEQFWLIQDTTLVHGAEIAEVILPGGFIHDVKMDVHPIFGSSGYSVGDPKGQRSTMLRVPGPSWWTLATAGGSGPGLC